MKRVQRIRGRDKETTSTALLTHLPPPPPPPPPPSAPKSQSILPINRDVSAQVLDLFPALARKSHGSRRRPAVNHGL